MWVETIVQAYPSTHLLFGVGGIDEVIRSCVDISQDNHRICWILPAKKIVYRGTEFSFFRNSPIVLPQNETRHLVSKSSGEKRSQMGQ
jgi:hypothetical protein